LSLCARTLSLFGGEARFPSLTAGAACAVAAGALSQMPVASENDVDASMSFALHFV
jgi:hypothetical protein